MLSVLLLVFLANSLGLASEYSLQPNTTTDCALGEAILILVHTHPNHTEMRNAIRETWGSVNTYKTVFLMGKVLDNATQKTIEAESEQHGDIVQDQSFVDAYRNMSLKHIMGYRKVRVPSPLGHLPHFSVLF